MRSTHVAQDVSVLSVLLLVRTRGDRRLRIVERLDAIEKSGNIGSFCLARIATRTRGVSLTRERRARSRRARCWSDQAPCAGERALAVCRRQLVGGEARVLRARARSCPAAVFAFARIFSEASSDLR